MSVNLPKMYITDQLTSWNGFYLSFIDVVVTQALNRYVLCGWRCWLHTLWHRTTLMTAYISTIQNICFSWALCLKYRKLQYVHSLHVQHNDMVSINARRCCFIVIAIVAVVGRHRRFCKHERHNELSSHMHVLYVLSFYYLNIIIIRVTIVTVSTRFYTDNFVLALAKSFNKEMMSVNWNL